MSLNVEKELAVLRRMTVGELRYVEAFGEASKVRDKDWRVKLLLLAR